MKKRFNFKRIIFIVALLYVSYVLISTQVSMNKIKAEMRVKEQELSKVKENNLKLQDEVKMSKTDAGIEKLARERLQMIKKGETPVINKK